MNAVFTRARKGFTLLEIVLALAVSSLLLGGASFFLYSLAQIWLRAETTPELEEHYLGVSSFLDYVLTQAETTSSNNKSASAQTANTQTSQAGESNAAGATGNLTWGYPPNEGTAGTPCIQFKLSEDLPIFVWQEGPLPPLTAWLWLDEKDGLYLIWKPDTASREYPADLYRTLLSPLVTKIDYLYYDESALRWETDDKPPSETLVSGTLKGVNFTFDLGGDIRTHKIYFRKRASALPTIY